MVGEGERFGTAPFSLGGVERLPFAEFADEFSFFEPLVLCPRERDVHRRTGTAFIAFFHFHAFFGREAANAFAFAGFFFGFFEPGTFEGPVQHPFDVARP